LDFSEVAYDSPFVESEDAVILNAETAVVCPDGEFARSFVAYRESLEGPAPAALLLHAGAFDYVITPDETDVLSGTTYRSTSRLTAQWGVEKAWETLGLSLNPVDPVENAKGTLPAALVDAGYVVLMPSNCWGDLWHAEQGVESSDLSAEGFIRNGRLMAQGVVDAIFEPASADTLGLRVPVEINLDEVHLVGLGDGARGITELLNHENNADRVFRSVVVDSTPDLLEGWASASGWDGDFAAGLKLIYGSEPATVDATDSLAVVAAEGRLPERSAFLWSSLDPNVPQAAVVPTALSLTELGLGTVVLDTAVAAHVWSNQNADLALDVVAFMTDGALDTAEDSGATP